MSDQKTEEYYKKQAKEEINMLFDKNFLNPDLTRESIDWLEDYMGFLFQSKCDMAARCAVLTARLKQK